MGTSPLKIAITFLTCERTDFTLQTLESLARHNDLSKFILLHADDASADQRGPERARALGFRTLIRASRKRQGVSAMTASLFSAASVKGADLVLNLQNDWQCVRPIPVDDIQEIFSDTKVYCLRLYGQFKSHHGRCGLHHGGREPLQVVQWEPYREGYEVGDIHWGHPPAVTRISQALYLTTGASAESESRKRSGRLRDLTVRVVDNVFMHIGRARTPGFVP